MRREVNWVWAAVAASLAYALGLGLVLGLWPASGETAGSALAPLEAVSFSPAPNSTVTLPPNGTLQLRITYNRSVRNLNPILSGRMTPGEFTQLRQDTSLDGKSVSHTIQTYPGKEFWLYVSLIDSDGRAIDTWWPGYIRTAPRRDTNPDLARDLHLGAWEKAIGEARAGDDIIRLGLYATRSLAVKHPEIYLRADRLFHETSSRNKGFRELYEDNPPTWTYDKFEMDAEERRSTLLLLEAQENGSPLDFRSLDLSGYRVIDRSELFPAGVPMYALVDHRVGILPVILKRQGGALTPIEMAFLRYFVQGPSGSSYVVLCEDGTAYLWAGGQGLLDTATGAPATATAPPLLIFNETHAWHPLMGRDDTARSAELRAVVESLGGGGGTGGLAGTGALGALGAFASSLSAEEKRLLADLESLTALSEADSPYALWAASKARYRVAHYEPYRTALGRIPYFPVDPGQIDSAAWLKFQLIGHTFQMLSNRLSPVAAWIAAQEFDDPLELTRSVVGIYYDLARAGAQNTARTVWRSELLWYDLEDSILCLAGNCAVQAGNVGAVLDLAGIENYLVWASEPAGGGHEYVYLPQFGKEVNNGYIVEVEGFFTYWLKSGGYNLASIGSGGRFIGFRDQPFLSTMTAAEAERILVTWREKWSRVGAFGHRKSFSFDEVLEAVRSDRVAEIDLKGKP